MHTPSHFHHCATLVVGEGHWARAVGTRLAREGAALVDAGGALDPTSEASWTALVEEIDAGTGHLDAVVVVTDPLRAGLAEELLPHDWTADLDAAIRPTYLALRHAVPLLRAGVERAESHGSTLTVVAPMWASAAVEGAPLAHAASGALVALVRNAAVSYGPDGVRANVVLAGLVEGGRLAAEGAATVEAVQACVPLGWLGAPEHLAAAVAFLASPEAAFITGAVLPVDGGYLAR